MAIPFAKRKSLSHSESIVPFILEVVKFNWMEISKYFHYSLKEFLKLIEENILMNYRKRYEITPEEIDDMAKECLQDFVILKENPVKVDEETLVRLYKKSLLG